MLNNINSHGLSKSKKAELLNYPGATNSDIIDKIDDVLDTKSESLIAHVVHVGFKKIVTKTKKKSLH